MRKPIFAAAALTGVLMLGGCVTQPLGPTVPVMPGKDKPLAQFNDDDYFCQHYASDRVAGKVDKANDKIAQNTAIGAILGTAVGAALGNTRGAVAGGVAGAAIGNSTANPGSREYQAQREYNIAYAQCMKSRGNEIEQPRYRRDYRDYPPPPPNYPPPPPPPGY